MHCVARWAIPRIVKFLSIQSERLFQTQTMKQEKLPYTELVLLHVCWVHVNWHVIDLNNRRQFEADIRSEVAMHIGASGHYERTLWIKYTSVQTNTLIVILCFGKESRKRVRNTGDDTKWRAVSKKWAKMPGRPKCCLNFNTFRAPRILTSDGLLTWDS